MHDLHGNELGLRPHAESDRVRAMSANDRQRRPSESRDLRSREGHVHVVEHRVFQRNIGTGDARRNLIVIVDDIMTSLPIFPGLAVRKRGGARRPETTPRGLPRRGDDVSIARETQVQRRRASAAPPREGGSLERLLEVHHAGPQAVIVQARETFEARREVSKTPRTDFLFLGNGKDAERRRGHDAQRTLGPDEEALQVEARSGPRHGPRPNHGAVRENGLQAEDLLSHRSAKVAESDEDRAPPMRPVPPPQGTILTPAWEAQRTTATTSSVVRGKTTAAGSSPRSAKGEPRCSRNASVRYRGAIDGPVRTRPDPRR